MSPGRFSKMIAYEGSSMKPFLETSNILYLSCCKDDNMKRGDVIAFRPPDSSDIVVHRIISISNCGIRTRGDNNNREDCWNLSPEHIFGRVVQTKHGNHMRTVHGGLRGYSYSLVVRFIRSIASMISSFLRPLYHRLAELGLFRRWVPTRKHMRVFSFTRREGIEFQLLMSGRVIGRLLPDRDQWIIRRPFRFFVDVASLPRRDMPDRQ